MPINHVTAVLAHSRSNGSHLLVLVIVAANADSRGTWITDQPTLQRQARLSRRRTQRVLADLTAAGELAYVPGKGRGNRSTFQLLIRPEGRAGTEPVEPAAEHTVSPPPPPPFPPDPLFPPTPQKQKPKTDETFGLVRRPLTGPQRAVLQVNVLFHQAGIALPPPAQIALWLKTLGGIEPLVELLDRLIRAGLATKNNPAAYVHRVVMKPAASPANTRHHQAARLAGLPGVEPVVKPIVEPVAERRAQEHRPPSRHRRSRRSPR